MLETLRCAQLADIHLDIGHMGVFRGLARLAELDAEQETMLFALLQRKANSELDAQLRAWRVSPRTAAMIAALPDLQGDLGVLRRAREALRGAPAAVKKALDAMAAVGALLRRQQPDLPVHVDLAELRGYHYHTGIMFAAYQPGRGQALALGGRYDNLGRVFGRGRPATGFSADLRALLPVAPTTPARNSRILAPANSDARLQALIARLRGRGEVVVCALPGQPTSAEEMGCGRRVARVAGRWTVVKA
jgi:ATP phosphoribosyltransferase regulatory subunit